MVLAITKLSVQSGSTSGGTAVTVTGTDFTVSTRFYFDEVLADSIVYVSATEMTLVSPVFPSPGEVAVVAKDSGFQSEPDINSMFFYYSPVASPSFENHNPYFDPLANYVFYGEVVFARQPLFASGERLSGLAAVTGGSGAAKLPPTGYVYVVQSLSTGLLSTYNGTA